MIKKSYFAMISCICLSMLSCSITQDTNSGEEEAIELSNMLARINEIANSEKCVNADEWRYTSFGSKPCGGPYGYIAYSSKIDTIAFLKLVEEHKSAQKKYNEEQGIMSDCSVPAEPRGITCENDKAVLLYP
ncbi:hypothetical protein [Sediminicola sp. YIK13]|uniref:hypothetical protein n=1 Tax=Sediminicola sp. YIK13 TaxID=1453352 RepID=UPI0011A6FC2D|nr:hypothetical protein [Sediminicola sp. YIK13]